MMNFQSLRQKHPQFVYEGFEIVPNDDNLMVYFNFSLEPDIKFRPELTLTGVNMEMVEKVGRDVFENLVFNLGMVELISYWKATCSPKILIKAGFLDLEQLAWWKNLIIKGLGEFYYKNEIDFTYPELVVLEVGSPPRQF